MNLLQSIVTVGAQGNLYSDGLAILVVGMSVVFIALIALIIILTFSGRFFEDLDKKEAAEKARAQAQVVVAPVVEEVVTEVVEEMDDLELVAVIAATIAASMGTSVEGLQVRSIRKTNNVWGMSGRTEQLYN